VGGELHTVRAARPTRILIATGYDPVHDWRATTPALRQLLSADPRMRVDVHDNLATLGEVDFASFGSVVIHFKNQDPTVPGPQALRRLKSYVRGGGGLVLVHFACGAFEAQRQQYAEMVGRVWFGLQPPPGRRQHDPRGRFQVRVRPHHPVTAGLGDFWTDDELYTCLVGDAPIEVVAQAVSQVDRESYPMALLRQFGRGRVFNCTLGHDVRALRVPAVGELYRRGTAWSAGLSPTQHGASGPQRPDAAAGPPAPDFRAE
jgi:type 1 glutamine amidotransferase